jgi:alpha-glycerophosphate oxidase/glycerol-3-phosphate dehydrogenase
MLYWLMGGCRLSPPRFLRRRDIAAEAPEVDVSDVIGGLEYSDGYLVENDARFVWSFVRRAMDAGALAANYVAVESLVFNDAANHWRAELRDAVDGVTLSLNARAVINAAGPWVDGFNEQALVATEHRHLFSKGIHLIVPRIGGVNRVLTFFASDGRLFFIIPMGNRTCIGTTDTPTDQKLPAVSEEDRQFVLDNINDMLALPTPLTRQDVIAERVGVRPLAVAGQSEQRDWVQLSRKHVVEVDETRRFLSIFGGKLTDCLNVGEEMIEQLAALGISGEQTDVRWYGEPRAEVWARYSANAAQLCIDEHTPAGADAPLSALLWRRYGEQAFAVLETIKADSGSLAPLFEGVALVRAELPLLLEREMVVAEDDLLRRRTMAALMLTAEELETSEGLQILRAAMRGAERSDDAA